MRSDLPEFSERLKARVLTNAYRSLIRSRKIDFWGARNYQSMAYSQFPKKPQRKLDLQLKLKLKPGLKLEIKFEFVGAYW